MKFGARRRSLSVVMATLGVALLGSACAVGHRNVFRGLASPAVPPMSQVMNERSIGLESCEPPAKASGNTQQRGVATTGSIDCLVPAPIAPATARAVAGAGTPTASAAMPTSAQDLGQSASANATAQPNH